MAQPGLLSTMTGSLQAGCLHWTSPLQPWAFTHRTWWCGGQRHVVQWAASSSEARMLGFRATLLRALQQPLSLREAGSPGSKASTRWQP